MSKSYTLMDGTQSVENKGSLEQQWCLILSVLVFHFYEGTPQMPLQGEFPSLPPLNYYQHTSFPLLISLFVTDLSNLSPILPL